MSDMQTVTISQLSNYLYRGTLSSDDKFFFSQSGSGTIDDVWTNPNGRFPVNGLSTGHISRVVEYSGLCASLSGALGIAGIKDGLDELSGKMQVVDRLSSSQWVRALPEVVPEFAPGAVTDAQLLAWEHDNTWPDQVNAAAMSAAGFFKNPRVVANIYEVSGVISALGVNDLSTMMRDVFNNNPTGRIISALRDPHELTCDDESYISAVTDQDGRVTLLGVASLSAMLARMFTHHEISDLIPGIDSYLGKTRFRDYTPFDDKTLVAIGNARPVATEQGGAVVFPEQDLLGGRHGD